MFVAPEIPGVNGAFPAVDLFLHKPVGAKTGQLLPTSTVCKVIAGYNVSCVDVAVPMAIAGARELGKNGYEPITDLSGDHAFMETLQTIWVKACLNMGLECLSFVWTYESHSNSLFGRAALFSQTSPFG